jgi:hypothetical protein
MEIVKSKNFGLEILQELLRYLNEKRPEGLFFMLLAFLLVF